jgi:uncharacterized membrane protein YqjE
VSEANGPAPSTGERSAGDLVTDISVLVPQLVREELRLAQLELTRKGKQAGAGAGLLAGSGLIAAYGAACLIAAVIIAISGAVAAWLAALIVGVALLAVSAAAALTGAGRLRRATPPVPELAVSNVQADVREIREKAQR